MLDAKQLCSSPAPAEFSAIGDRVPLMTDTSGLPLAAWDSFYVIVGSSSAALTGLMFVVVALIPDVRMPASSETLAAFGTPTVVHFCAVLLISAALCAPWDTLGHAAFVVGAVGIAGLAYVTIVARRAKRQTDYEPVFADWLWHAGLPFAAYAGLIVSWFALGAVPTGALFGFGAASLFLLFIGIHNAWDTVTYIALERPLIERAAAAVQDASRKAGTDTQPDDRPRT
jgi:hypothetical protein